MINDNNHPESPSLWPDGGGPLRVVPDPPVDDALIIDVAGFEGPLDLLLQLARNQKVDIAKISILALAEQYLEFIHAARRMKLELAADYLVMAAWLAYLKSRLLIPQAPEDDDTPAEELAARLAFRLQRLQAMRDAAAQLMARNQLGRDVFERGAPEPLVIDTKREYADNLVDLLKAYAERRQKEATHHNYEIRKLPLWSIKEARAALERLIGTMDDWGRFDVWLSEYLVEPERRPSVIASSFTASLELVREGKVEIRQEKAFEPIYMRRGSAVG
ncbi:MAG: segregation/condensation protein A [Rhizobiales bacterium]|nr:segregation/condensation protein A [Hyphomicrobiales bacterium]